MEVAVIDVDVMEVAADVMEVGVMEVEVAEMVCDVEVESDSRKIRNVQQG
jgi:hypothetical protein